MGLPHASCRGEDNGGGQGSEVPPRTPLLRRLRGIRRLKAGGFPQLTPRRGSQSQDTEGLSPQGSAAPSPLPKGLATDFSCPVSHCASQKLHCSRAGDVSVPASTDAEAKVTQGHSGCWRAEVAPRAPSTATPSTAPPSCHQPPTPIPQGSSTCLFGRGEAHTLQLKQQDFGGLGTRFQRARRDFGCPFPPEPTQSPYEPLKMCPL